MNTVAAIHLHPAGARRNVGARGIYKRRQRRLLLVWLGLTVQLVLTGCNPTLPEGKYTCDKDSDCLTGWFCRIGTASNKEKRCFRTPRELTEKIAASGNKKVDSDPNAPRENAMDANESDTGQSELETANANDGGSSAVPPEPCSAEGELRCSRKTVDQRELCQEGTWQPGQACAAGEVCVFRSHTCQKLAAICQGSTEQAVCDGQGVMYICGVEGAEDSQERCLSERHCQTGLAKRTCASCLPGEFRCVGARLEACTIDGSSYAQVEQCKAVPLCNSTLGACTTSACVAGKPVCKGDVLFKCNADQTALQEAERCGAGLCDNISGECDICTPGQKICDGDVVLTCDMLGRAFERRACSDTTPQCAGAGQCVACTQDSECSDPGACKRRYCNIAKGTCDPVDMGDGAPCDNGVCSGGSCVGCIDNNDCKGKVGKTFCDTANKNCVECVASTNCTTGTCADNRCVGVCGNNRVESGEECDDGNKNNEDKCPTSCQWAECGDSFVRAGFEQCDPGDPIWASVCDANCRLTTYGSCANGCDPNQCKSDIDTCAPTCAFDTTSKCPNVAPPWTPICHGSLCYIECSALGVCPWRLFCVSDKTLEVTVGGWVEVTHNICVARSPTE